MEQKTAPYSITSAISSPLRCLHVHEGHAYFPRKQDGVTEVLCAAGCCIALRGMKIWWTRKFLSTDVTSRTVLYCSLLSHVRRSVYE
jgi:hypothetical protein